MLMCVVEGLLLRPPGGRRTNQTKTEAGKYIETEPIPAEEQCGDESIYGGRGID
jgi:hypothetical protein